MENVLHGTSVDRFIGRTDELGSIRELMGQGCRLLTLRGTGGVGKTRLAQEYARAQSSATYFVDLTEARSLSGITHATALALDLVAHGEDDDSVLQRIGEAICRLGPALLIFDNFEQVVCHAANTVGLWRRQAPETAFLITSREALDLRGEHILPLDPLSPDDASKLFLARARSNGSSWVDDEAQHADIMPLTEALDGIPLAIELAAARSMLMTPAAILARLDSRLAVLGRGKRDHGQRQATVYGLIEWSWSLLDEAERCALAQMSVFHGGFLLDAAEAVISVPKGCNHTPLDLVESLTRKSLLRVRNVRGQTRVDMYVSVHAFATEKLQAMQTQPVCAGVHMRHARYFEGIEPTYSVLPIKPELDNLIAAQKWALAHGETDCLYICTKHMANVFFAAGPWLAGVQAAQLALKSGFLEADQEWSLFQDVFLLLMRASRFDEAEAHLEESASLSKQLDSPKTRVAYLGQKGRILVAQGKLEEGAEHFLRAAEIRERPQEALIAKANAVFFLIELGNLESALENLEHISQPEAREVNYRVQIAAESHHGRYCDATGQPDEARKAYKRFLALGREHGDQLFEALALARLAELDLKEESFTQARAKLEANIETLEVTIPSHARRFKGALALAMEAAGDLELASQTMESAVQSQGRFLWPTDGVILTLYEAQLHHCRGDHQQAEQKLRHAQKLAQELALRPQSPIVRDMDTFAQKLRTPGSAKPVLVVESSLQWFTVGDGERVWVARRKAMRRILGALAAQRNAGSQSSGLDVGEAFAAGWPGDQLPEESQRDRVYTAIGSLRTMGLGDILVRQPDGYALDPSFPFRWHAGD